MKKENIVNITGYVYKHKKAFTQSRKEIHTFGLQIWNGKKDDKNVYEFINVKFFGSHPIIADRTEVLVTGRLAVEKWLKDGKQQTQVVIIAEVIKQDVTSKPSPTGDSTQGWDSSPSDPDDDIGF